MNIFFHVYKIYIHVPNLGLCRSGALLWPYGGQFDPTLDDRFIFADAAG